MGLFDFIRTKKTPEPTPEAPSTSIHIKSIEAQDSISVVVIAIAKGLDCIYLNTYESQIFEGENQGSASFRGPVYRINLSLNNSENFNIFYGIVTDDRRSIVSSMNSIALDTMCTLILKELVQIVPGIYDLRKFKKAPTHHTFYLEKFPKGYYITNNSGNDSYFLPLDRSKIMAGDRDSILTRIQSA